MAANCYNVGILCIRGIFFALSSSVKLALYFYVLSLSLKDLIENTLLEKNEKIF